MNGILAQNTTVLFAKRALTKHTAPGGYHLPGGHVEPGEKPEAAIVREFMEEFGLDVAVDSKFATFSYRADDTPVLGATFILSAKSRIADMVIDPKETESIVWVDRSVLQRTLSYGDHDYAVLKKYFATISQ